MIWFAESDAFVRLGDPKSGEWLDRFEEEHLTFEHYVDGDPVRADGDRHTLAFVPVGAFDDDRRAAMDASVALCAVWFDLPVSMLAAGELPNDSTMRRSVRNAAGEDDYQYRTDWFLRRFLPRRLPDDGVILVAVTSADLYPGPDWNYVFGQASLRNRVGVYSLARFFNDFWDREQTEYTKQRGLERTLQLVVHEVGHAFGLTHCVVYACTMNGSNSLAESDRKPLHLCPDCLRKLQWNRGFDVEDRYRALAAFYEEHGVADEAEWLRERIESVTDRE